MKSLKRRIRAVIVDDEKLARARIRRLLASHPDVDVVRECSSGYEAVEAVDDERPDLLFLDIQMPEMDGFDVIETLSGKHGSPHVIIVTAFDRYAIRAFEVHAFDYLLKPISAGRLDAAVARARDAMISRSTEAADFARLLAELGRRPPRRFTIRSSERIYFVPYEEVDWIEAAGNYVRLHTRKETHLLRSSTQALEATLEGTPFVRIHRSTLVNVDRIKELKPSFFGSFEVILHDGQRLTMSRTHRDALERIAGERAP